jgi:polyhydroxyalkanoate synthesis regulator phasin
LSAQKKGGGKGQAGTKSRVDIENLVENQDVLFELSAGHTKDIRALEQRIQQLEKKIAEAGVEGENLKKLSQELEETKQELENLKKQVKEANEQNERKLKLEPRFELRVRPEFRQNMTDLNSDENDKDWQYLQRLRLGLALKATKDFTAVVVLQDSRLWGEEASTLPSNDEIKSKTLVHEGYLQMDNIFLSGLGFQAGRMEMKFGAERQIGAVDWHNVGRAFDGLRVFYKKPKAFSVDAFFAMVADRGRESGPNTDLSGVYVSADFWKFLTFDVYGLYLYNEESFGTEHIGTVGLRAVGKPVKGLEIEGEGAWQFGKSLLEKQQGTKEHVAAAYFAKVSYEFLRTENLTPNLGVFFYSASGDANTKDSRNVAYRVLYPTTHQMLGFMDLFQWTGIVDFGPSVKVKFLKDFGFLLDYHAFFLSSDGGVLRDAFGAEAVMFPSDKGRFVGHEMDLVVSWKAHKYLSFETGYSFFKPGSVTKNAKRTSLSAASNAVTPATLALGKDMAHFFYFQGKVSF